MRADQETDRPWLSGLAIVLATMCVSSGCGLSVHTPLATKPPMAPSAMTTVYQLRDDTESIESMQRASLDSGPIGLRITHGLIASQEWWDSIEAGTLPVETVAGTVSGFWPGQWRAGPAEFEILESSGRKSRWMCELEVNAAEQAYRIGRPVRVRYVHQRLKTLSDGKDDSTVVLSIEVG